MNELLPTGGAFYAFLAASVVLAVTPGPGVLYIVARTLAQGRSAGLASVAGVALGNFGNAVGASLGLAALFAVSSAAFTIVKLAGAAYLVFLGVQALRPAPPATPDVPPVAMAGHSRLFRDGFLVALLNPKTTLFFAAFLPQFLHATAAAPALQTLALSAVFVLIAASTDSLYVLLAGALAPSLRAGRAGGAGGRVLAAAVYIGLGVYTAFSQAQAGADPAR